MFSHVMVGAHDIEVSKAFYDAVLGALGAKPGRTDPKGRVFWAHNGAMFMISKPIDGGDATHANGGTIGFAGTSAEQIDAWHAAGLAHGGTTCEEPPGIRQGNAGQLYLAYLRDPAGNKLCGVHRLPA